LATALASLAIVLVPGIGHTANGATRWIELGPVMVQVSEPARLFLLLYIAGYASRRQVDLQYNWAGLLRPVALVLLACLLLLMEPNYGAAVILAAIGGLMLFIAGSRLRYLVADASGGLRLLARA